VQKGQFSVSKTVEGYALRGFESLPLRHLSPIQFAVQAFIFLVFPLCRDGIINFSLLTLRITGKNKKNFASLSSAVVFFWADHKNSGCSGGGVGQMKLTIKSITGLVFGGLSLAIAVLAVLLLYGISTKNEAIKTIYQDRVVPLRDLKTVSDSYAITVVDNTVKANLGVLGYENAASAIENAMDSAERKWIAYIKTALTNEERELIRRTEPLLATVGPTVERIVSALKAGDEKEISLIARTVLYRDIEPLTKALDGLIHIQSRATNEIYADTQATSAVLTALAWSVVVAAALVVFMAIVVLRRRVTRPVGAMTECMRALADGQLDLTIPFADREDEVGKMANAAEVFRRTMVEHRALQAQAVEAAEEANRAKDDFLASMSHELRTPLNAIIGIVEMVLEDIEAGGSREDEVESLQRVLKAGWNLLALINDILDISKIEAGRVELNMERTEVGPIIVEVVDTVRQVAENNNTGLDWQVADDVGTIKTDGLRFRQILLNLLSNACKFTENGSVSIAVCRIAEPDGREVLRVAVRDTGIGLTDEQKTGLFDKFVQADSAIAKKFGGTGLGLAISRHLANMLGGDIRVASTYGEGSTFVVILPVGEECSVSEACLEKLSPSPDVQSHPTTVDAG